MYLIRFCNRDRNGTVQRKAVLRRRGFSCTRQELDKEIKTSVKKFGPMGTISHEWIGHEDTARELAKAEARHFVLD